MILAKASNPIHREMKTLLAKNDMSLTEVVAEMNKQHPERKKTTVQNISNKLTRGTIKFSEIIEICNIIGVTDLNINEFLTKR